ncbi:signal peptidase I [Modestobacter versicolor]|uniref:signal peptidase I n=1 Tax=Modestobacter versicolor TaxID=429133 RepID=UPI0034DEE487
MSTHGPEEPADPRATGKSATDESATGEVTPATGSAAVPGRRRGGRTAEKKKGSLLRELPVLLVIAFVLALLVKTFLVQAFFIPSGSMEQTLHGCTGCTGDRVLVNKVPYWFGEPEPGDIVVFRGPDTWSPEIVVTEPSNWVSGALLGLGRAIGVAPPSEDDYVKRVIATAGQTVECCDAEGRVLVDGEPLTEPYLYQDSPLGGGPNGREFGPVTVPEGRLWVMGDHRSASADSRRHVSDQYSGTIAVDDVIGKGALIVWPLDRFTLLDSPDIQGTDDQGLAGPVTAPSAPGAAAVAAPLVLGLTGAVPVTAWRRRRRARRARLTGPSRRPPRTGWRRVSRPVQTRPARENGTG